MTKKKKNDFEQSRKSKTVAEKKAGIIKREEILLKKFQNSSDIIPKNLLTWSIITFLMVIFAYSVFILYFSNKIYPNIYVSGISLSGKTKPEALSHLDNSIKKDSNFVLVDGDKDFQVQFPETDIQIDIDETVKRAYSYHRNRKVFISYFQPIYSLSGRIDTPLVVKVNEDNIKKILKDNLKIEEQEAIYPSLQIANGDIKVNTGAPGKAFNIANIYDEILGQVKGNFRNKILLEVEEVNPELTENQAETYKIKGQKHLDKNITAYYEDREIIVSKQKLLDLISPDGYYENKVASFSGEIKKQVDREPQNAVFVFNEGKVSEFVASKDGLIVNKEELKDKIIESLNDLSASNNLDAVRFEIPVTNTRPEITMENVNNLGIKELLGRGTSKFAHSISTRVHNIGLAATKFNGILLKPGESFSFNQTLGDVSSYTGYKQAYVIRSGRTILGDGGGVCQVSTTLFRAILDAGLPITERRAHSYRVGYYEQDSPPGLDATVYSPSPDLKFVNDTPRHILIQTEFDSENMTLAFEIYGTKDGRVSEVTKPKIISSTPPPEDSYIDDPTLPSGTVKQIEYKAWGARVSFDYKVTRNGEEIIKKTFTSNYTPWGAVYLRGTAPVN